MIRILVFIVCLGLVIFGLGWIADQPGDIAVTFRGQRYETSPLVAVAAVLVVAFVVAMVFGFLSFLTRVPRRMRARARAKRAARGMTALSKGMIAASAGDTARARRASEEATRHLGTQPLTLLLEAQTAMLSGDRAGAERGFTRMTEHPETRVLGLRGLHIEARKRGDAEAAHAFAEAAHRIAPLPWAGQAVLDHHAGRNDWTRALEAVNANLGQKIIDKATAKRQRAVLKTALALDFGGKDAEDALKLASEAVALAPDLTPASALAGRLLARRGDMRRASRLLEAAWKLGPHPDLAEVYLDMRPGDSSADRLRRAQTLARIAPNDPESRLAVARAANAARDFSAAREAMAPLIAAESGSRPTARVCMMMAELEEAENGPTGVAREWLARASRAPRDKAWVADGVVSDSWAPFSPVSGQLDAWSWRTPPEKLSNAWDPRQEPAPDPEAAAPLVQSIPPRPQTRPATDAGAAAFPLVSAPDDPGTARV